MHHHKKSILVVGCSMTRGHGLKNEQDDDALWVNQICTRIGFEKNSIKNLSKTGANNHWIFLETACALMKQEYDVVIVGWSSIPRFNFHVGLELYPVETMLNDIDVNINPGITFKGKWLENIKNDLLKLHNDHWDILDLIKYVNILIRLQETQKKKKIFFVNTLSPWSRGYFIQKEISLPSDLGSYEQDLLQTQSRDDQEILDLYNMIHLQYNSYGGIKESHWLNLYDSLRSMQIDDVSEIDPHPGYQSQSRYVDFLFPLLQRKLENIEIG